MSFNQKLKDLAKRVDDLGETVTLFKDPVDGAAVAALDWQAVERILDKLQPTELEGAGDSVPPMQGVQTAGQFAARWNTLDEQQREDWVVQLLHQRDTAARCFQADHDGLKDQYESLRAKVLKYANDRHDHARSTKLNTLSSWRVWSDLYGILGLPTS